MEKSRFFDSTTEDIRRYTSEDLAEFFRTFYTTGVVAGLKVNAYLGGVDIHPGTAIINGYWYKNDDMLSIAIPPLEDYEGGEIARRDLVALSLDLTSDVRSINAVYLTGTKDAYPTPEDTKDVMYVPLAVIGIGVNLNITGCLDKRIYSSGLYEVDISTIRDEASAAAETVKTLSAEAINNILTASGGLPIAAGGTGAATASAAFSVLSEDTGWQTPTFSSGQYWTNGATSINARFKPVEYRRIGKQVFIDGFFKCNDLNNSFSTIDEKTLFVLPAGYRPRKSLYWRLPMSGQQYAKVYVTEGGTVGMDFTTATTLTASTWFNFNNVSFFVDAQHSAAG